MGLEGSWEISAMHKVFLSIPSTLGGPLDSEDHVSKILSEGFEGHPRTLHTTNPAPHTLNPKP